MLVYRILTDKHSLKKKKKKKKPIFSSQLNTELDENSFHQTLDGTLMCLTLHVLSFTADLTWSFPPSKKNKKKPKKNHVPLKTSSAAGWRRSGSSGASPPPVAPCCASRSPASPGSRGSAVKTQEFVTHTAREALWQIHFAQEEWTWQKPECCFLFVCFVFILKRDVFVYLVEGSCQENADLLHPVGGGDRPAANASKKRKYQKSTWLKMMLDILKILLKLKLQWLMD